MREIGWGTAVTSVECDFCSIFYILNKIFKTIVICRGLQFTEAKTRDLKIYDATARRQVIKTKQIFIEDNNYE